MRPEALINSANDLEFQNSFVITHSSFVIFP